MNKLYNYPDGTETNIRPTDGEICKTPSHKRGKDTYYEWDDESGNWYIIPNHFTDPAVIEKSKEILQIGKFYSKRPPKKYHYYDFNEYDSFSGFMGPPFGPYRSANVYGHPNAANSAFNQNNLTPDGTPICEVTERYKTLMSNLTESRSKRLAAENENAIAKLKCECGAHYTRALDKHYSWCPMFGKNDF